ncbi:MAG: hypothetical protein AAGA65_21595 [Actinomycetota bacterium]
MSELLRDLGSLPVEVQESARLTAGDREVMWRRADAEGAIQALASSGLVVLGLDVRRYLPDGRFQEAAWSALASEHSDDAATGCAEALAALARLDDVDDLDGYDWVLVTW